MYKAIFKGIAWVSERKGLPTRRDQMADAYHDNVEWQEYLDAHMPRNMNIIVTFDDSKKFKIQRDDTIESTDIYVDVPSDEFRNGADPVATYGSVVERVYTWVAKEFGWPPPPPPIRL